MTSDSNLPVGGSRCQSVARHLPDPAQEDASASLAPEPVEPVPCKNIWLQRVSMVVFVMFCLELGMVLAVLPWTRVWTDNSLLYNYPNARAFLSQGFVRGAFTGLGLIDLWIGIWEAIHYRESRQTS